MIPQQFTLRVNQDMVPHHHQGMIIPQANHIMNPATGKTAPPVSTASTMPGDTPPFLKVVPRRVRYKDAASPGRPEAGFIPVVNVKRVKVDFHAQSTIRAFFVYE